MLDENLDLILDSARDSMHKSLEHLAHELNSVRAGRANPAMVEDVRAEVYGAHMPLNQLANVSAPQADLIVIQPWDRSTLNPIERAIRAANLGFNPSNDGTLIRISVPPPTQERRQELAKVARHRAEEARIAVRNVRRDAKGEIQRVQKAESLSEDLKFQAEDLLQKMTDEHIAKVDAMLVKKEKEIMEV